MIEPLLAVQGMRDAVLDSPAPVVAISPIIGGAAVKGPAADILRSLGHDVSALGVARLYDGLADLFIVDEEDEALVPDVTRETGLRCVALPTLMTDLEAKRALAQATVDYALRLGAEGGSR